MYPANRHLVCKVILVVTMYLLLREREAEWSESVVACNIFSGFRFKAEVLLSALLYLSV